MVFKISSLCSLFGCVDRKGDRSAQLSIHVLMKRGLRSGSKTRNGPFEGNARINRQSESDDGDGVSLIFRRRTLSTAMVLGLKNIAQRRYAGTVVDIGEIRMLNVS